MKKIIIAVLSAILLAAAVTALAGCSDKNTIVLNVYNWGEYISTGEEGTYNTNKEFENGIMKLTVKKSVSITKPSTPTKVFAQSLKPAR